VNLFCVLALALATVAAFVYLIVLLSDNWDE